MSKILNKSIFIKSNGAMTIKDHFFLPCLFPPTENINDTQKSWNVSRCFIHFNLSNFIYRTILYIHYKVLWFIIRYYINLTLYTHIGKENNPQWTEQPLSNNSTLKKLQ